MKIHPRGRGPLLAGSDYVDVHISLDGATAEVNDAVRGQGSYATALRAIGHLADAGFPGGLNILGGVDLDNTLASSTTS